VNHAQDARGTIFIFEALPKKSIINCCGAEQQAVLYRSAMTPARNFFGKAIFESERR
jgi:hypothetical protein